MEARMSAVETDLAGLQEWRKSIDANTVATRNNTQMLEDLGTALKAMSWFTKALKWLAIAGGGFAAMYAAYRGYRA